MEIVRYEDKCEDNLRKFERWLGKETVVNAKWMINKWYEISLLESRKPDTLVSEFKADYFDVLSFLHKSRCIL